MLMALSAALSQQLNTAALARVGGPTWACCAGVPLEVHLTSKLSHPNVVGLFAYATTGAGTLAAAAGGAPLDPEEVSSPAWAGTGRANGHASANEMARVSLDGVPREEARPPLPPSLLIGKRYVARPWTLRRSARRRLGRQTGMQTKWRDSRLTACCARRRGPLLESSTVV